MKIRCPVVAIAVADFSASSVMIVGGQKVYSLPRIKAVELVFEQARMSELVSGECLNIDIGPIQINDDKHHPMPAQIEDAKVHKWTIAGEEGFATHARLVGLTPDAPILKYVVRGTYVQWVEDSYEQRPNTSLQESAIEKIKALNGLNALVGAKAILRKFAGKSTPTNAPAQEINV